MASTDRLLLLLSLLQTRRDWSGPVLAERLEISHRTVRRDVDRLREMGYRIEATHGPDGGYRLEAGTELPPLLFDDEQALALAVALQAAATTGAGIEEAAVRALTTVRQVMPSRLRHRLDALSFESLPASGPEPVSADLLVALSAAIRARETVRFDYAAPRHMPSTGAGAATGAGAGAGAATGTATATAAAAPRQAEPHGLVMANRRWYLLAWDASKDDWRTFRVDRIGLRTPNGRRFAPREIPGGAVARFVAGRFKGSPAADVWPCVGSAILRLPARDVVPYIGGGTIDDLGDGRCRVVLGAWSWVGLAASLGRFDAPLEQVRPAELAAAFGELATRFAHAAQLV